MEKQLEEQKQAPVQFVNWQSDVKKGQQVQVDFGDVALQIQSSSDPNVVSALGLSKVIRLKYTGKNCGSGLVCDVQNLYVLHLEDPNLWVHDKHNGVYRGKLKVPGMTSPKCLELLSLDPTVLAITDRDGNSLHKVSTGVNVGGKVVLVDHKEIKLGFEPWRVTLCADRKLIIADRTYHRVVVMDEDGHMTNSVKLEPRFGCPTQAIAVGDGFLVSSRTSHKIAIVDRGGNILRDCTAGISGSTLDPFHMTTDRLGRIVVVDFSNKGVGLYGPDLQLLQCLLKDNEIFGGVAYVFLDTEVNLLCVHMGNAEKQEVWVYNYPVHDLPRIKAPHSLTNMKLSVKLSNV